MKLAYADPPYLGCGRLYAAHHPDALDWDDPETHRRLFQRLQDEFSEGWAVSCHTPSLRVLLPMTPADTRIGAWVKPFAVFKPNVPVAYAWEPVLFRGGRRRGRDEPTVRDWHSENITLKKGLPGAKPPKFAIWVSDLLGVDWEQDTLEDIFPGTHGMTLIWRERQQPQQLPMEAA